MGFAKYNEDILSRLICDKYMNKKITVVIPEMVKKIEGSTTNNASSTEKQKKDTKMNSLKQFVINSPRPLPVIVLADTSGSMSADGKINVLNEALKDMIATFATESRLRAEIQVAIITFGGKAELHMPLIAAIGCAEFTQLKAAGATPMGDAFDLARQLLEDKDIIPSRAYRPVLILLSDGQPTDDWSAPFRALCDSERAQKATRLAMAIGPDADEAMLKDFANDAEVDIFKAHNARDIHRFFRAVTMSVTTRTTSQNPDSSTGFVVPQPDDNALDLDF